MNAIMVKSCTSLFKGKIKRAPVKQDAQPMCLYFKVCIIYQKRKEKVIVKLFWDQHANAVLIIEN